MTKRPVHKETHIPIQKHVKQQDATDIQKHIVCVFCGSMSMSMSIYLI